HRTQPGPHVHRSAGEPECSHGQGADLGEFLYTNTHAGALVSWRDYPCEPNPYPCCNFHCCSHANWTDHYNTHGNTANAGPDPYHIYTIVTSPGPYGSCSRCRVPCTDRERKGSITGLNSPFSIRKDLLTFIGPERWRYTEYRPGQFSGMHHS